jgi:hypothetical protein
MKSLSDAQAAFLSLVAETITPEVAALDAAGRARMTAIIDAALMERDAATRSKIGSFLTLIRIAPVIRYGRTFGGLDAGRRNGVLRWFESCPVGLLRKGFWGLKVLVFMGYYGQEETWSEIGYAPVFDARSSVRHA